MLGEALRKARKTRCFTQESVARQAGVSAPTVVLLEQGGGRLGSWNRVLDALELELRGRNLPAAGAVGKGIALLRKRRRLSGRAVAEMAGISHPTLVALEKRSSGTLGTLDRVLSVLGAGPCLVARGASPTFYTHAATSSGHHGWETPKWLLEKLYAVFGRFDLDPCSGTKSKRRSSVRARVRFTAEDDGLSLPWFGVVFVNPPYGRELAQWTAKAKGEVECGNAKTVVGLVPARTDTKWWHRDIAGDAAVLFLKGRLSFGKGGQSAPFPSALVVWGGAGEMPAKLRDEFPDGQFVEAR